VAIAPLIVEIKGNSLDDGPGIRSVVFFKGCPLSCDWCHNPEGKELHVELAFDAGACVHAGACVKACEAGALDAGRVDRERCTRCMLCVEVCPSGALRTVGRQATLAEILRVAERYKPFYRTSGGGVTVSGGEPTLHMEFLGELLSALKALGVHTLLETCGQFSLESYLARVDPYVDQVYFDIKILDDEAHRRHCGSSNARTLANFRALHVRSVAGGTPVLARIALIPERTATAENLEAAARFLRDCGASRVALLDYNPLWHAKAVKLGGTPCFARSSWLTPEERARARAYFADFEVV
jgi:pyruvate formate lyase activating enzyme